MCLCFSDSCMYSILWYVIHWLDNCKGKAALTVCDKLIIRIVSKIWHLQSSWSYFFILMESILNMRYDLLSGYNFTTEVENRNSSTANRTGKMKILRNSPLTPRTIVMTFIFPLSFFYSAYYYIINFSNWGVYLNNVYICLN